MLRFLLPLSCKLLILFYLLPASSNGQCLSYPVSLNERVNNAQSILLGNVVDQYAYQDEKGNIYTLNKVNVDAWIKNSSAGTEVYVITLGGMMNGKAQLTYPAVQLTKGQRYFLMLENDDALHDDKVMRNLHPDNIQAMLYADAQGAWLFQNGKYHDLFVEGALSEADLLQKIFSISGLRAVKPDGSTYTPSNVSGRSDATDAITSFGPNPTDAGTIEPSDFLTINGSGFGNAPGIVQFPNADNGGSTFITPPNASDYVSWTDNTIVVKVPTGNSANAGSGFFMVNGAFSSPQSLTIRYSHISLNGDYSGFATDRRQRYYLRNMDGLGGYTFLYNNDFANNASAVAAYERALVTWTCNTGINWKTGGVTTMMYANDDQNVVLFDASLPAGVLARATSRFEGSATGICNQENTVWWLEEIDIQARPTGVAWQFGPSLATGSQYDFETVILHELGHAHGLGHRIAPGQLMNYSVSNASNIRTPAPQEVQGGVDKMAYSTAPTCFNPTGSGTPMIASGCPIPVTLLSFTGELKKHGAELKWRTQNEINSNSFEVQRSINGVDYTAIGSIRAKGNTSTEQLYQFIDAAIKQGTYYYRLKMIDNDGSFKYSVTIVLKVNEAIRPFSVFPNPASNEFQIISAIRTTVNLVDGKGRVVRQFQINAGNNYFDVSNLNSGLYYLVDQKSENRLKLMIIH